MRSGWSGIEIIISGTIPSKGGGVLVVETF